MDVVVLELVQGSQFRVIGRAPEWFNSAFEIDSDSRFVDPTVCSAFIDNFLVDAATLWKDGEENAWISSGPFSEQISAGLECTLEAIAMFAGAAPVLLIKYPTASHETVAELLQQSRMQSIEYGHLLKEINKREVLLHCIVHDLSTPLAGVKGSLELMGTDGLIHPDGSKLHEIGLNQIAKMQRMIAEILETFSAETMRSHTQSPANDAPDVGRAARAVATLMEPLANEAGVSIQVLDNSVDEPARVNADLSRLERVIFNLVDNALRYAPSGSTIRIRIKRETKSINVHVEDSGPGVAESFRPHLFARQSQGSARIGKAGLGLYFCKITVADWGGTLGYNDLPDGGADFWFRVDRSQDIS